MHDTSLSHASDPDEAEATPRLSWGRVFAYCLANVGYCMFYALNNGVLPLWLERFTRNAPLINLLSGSHSFEGIVLQPVVGSVSDRLRTRWGRRRPLIVIFTPISCLFLLLTPTAAHLPASVRLAGIVACIVLFTMTFNLAYDPYQALLADATSPSQRGEVASVWYVANAVGQVLILMKLTRRDIPLDEKFVWVALSMLLFSLIAVAFTPEPSSLSRTISEDEETGEGAHPTNEPATVRGAHRHAMLLSLRGLSTLKQARLFLLMNLIYGAGTDAVVPNITRFTENITHCNAHEAQAALMTVMLTAGTAVFPCGWLADHIGFKRILIAGVTLVGVASLLGMWVHTLPQVYMVMVVAGLGTACQNASAYPLLTRIVPAGEIGFYTGLQTAAASIAGPVALVVTGVLTMRADYRMIFVVCGACVILSLAFLLPIRMERAREEVAERKSAALPQTR